MPARRPLLAIAACVGAGAAASGPHALAWAAALLALAATALALAWVAPARAAISALAAAAVAVGAAAGIVEHAAYAASPLLALASNEDAGPVEIHGIARRDAVPGDERFVLLVDVDGAKAGGRARSLDGRGRVEVGGGAARPMVSDGDRVTVWDDLRVPRPPGTPGSFDAPARSA